MDESQTAEKSEITDYQQALEKTLGVPFNLGNSVRVLRNGAEIFPPMLEAIRQAQFTVEFLTFVYWEGNVADEFAEALAARARDGVKVRVILDAVGAMKMSKSLVESMEEAGVNIVWFRPTVRWKVWKADNRTHRKVLVCDGRVAFTGGVGIAQQWEGDARNSEEWRDTHFQIEGPAVHGLQAAFIDNWVEADQSVRGEVTQIIRAEALEKVGDSKVQVLKTAAAVNWSPIATMFHVLLTMARHKVRITTAYFVPNPGIVRLLRETAERGVDVQILLPGPYHDQHVAQLAQEDEYAPLLEAGVRMWSYQRSMLHAKVVTIDDQVACVGSANFNQRSMSKDDELSLLILDGAILNQLDSHFEDDCKLAEEMHAENYRQRSFFRRAKVKALSLFRQQM